MKKALKTMRTWGEMVRFSHSVFALPFAVMAAFLAGRGLPGGRPTVGQLLLVVSCMVFARSAAMTFNRIADFAIDARNPRTAGRPMQSGAISKPAAWAFFVLASAGFVVACAGFWWLDGNAWPIALAAPVLAYLCFYSYTKRFTRWSHFVLGSAIAISPAAAWIAVNPATLGWPAAILVAAVTLWIGGFDVIYACQDIEIDRREGLHSLPSRLGPGSALWIARAAHGTTVALLVALGAVCELGWLYVAGVIAVAALLLIENLLVRADDFSRVNLAFFTINGVVSLLLGAVAVADVLLDLAPALPSVE